VRIHTQIRIQPGPEVGWLPHHQQTTKGNLLRGVAAGIVLFSLLICGKAIANGTEERVCDVSADYSLGNEDYPKAIRLHLEVLRRHPENALAHYHLGYAYGMVGDRTGELREYRQAEGLGLRSWDLFLNMGLARLQTGDLAAATTSLQQSVFLGPGHPESHFNLALVYEQRGMLADAERETVASLRLNGAQPDARNLLGVIYAQQGQFARASCLWRELLLEIPDFAPARSNLETLNGQSTRAGNETSLTIVPRRAVSFLFSHRSGNYTWECGQNSSAHLSAATRSVDDEDKTSR
jgi:Flp pilus assembly protein TadD